MKAHIVNMKNKKSVIHPGMEYRKGFAIYVDDYGFLSIDGGKTVYIPCGGRKACKEIIAMGLGQPSYKFIDL